MPSGRRPGGAISFAPVDADHFFYDLPTLGRMLRRRAMSSLELTRSYLQRLERLGPTYNALAELTRDLAERDARRADRERGRGVDRGPLHGIPYGAKDLLDTAGIATRWGAPPYRDRVPSADATVIKRLREAGAVLVGKLAMVELAGGGGYRYASASLHGPGLNPWNRARWSGGSSSGSGSAVAAGLVPYALGSETWGSITTPSAFCGVSGLRPSLGVVSRAGAMPLAWSMDKIGPMARTAGDCGVILAALAGVDASDATTTAWSYRQSRARSFTLGVLPEDFDGIPDVERAFDDALRVMRRAGARTKKIKLPSHDYAATARTILTAEQAATHEDFIKSERLDELIDEGQKEGLRASLQQPNVEYARAIERRLSITRDLRALFDDLDALVGPTLVAEAPTLDTDLREMRRGIGPAVFGALAGLPAVSIPMGFGSHGMPLGLSLTGDLFAEGTIVAIASAYQRDTDWHERRPITNVKHASSSTETPTRLNFSASR
ncbi:MAG: hypothetical protein AUH85_00680 [Chloroflexi bacterium 13_1_40CM_4_68_4]|nr:MAG: hypothetical protein AUH85_00680 [Chloroflexi bacterium 13_1_40CM_4_68_4]